MNKVNGFTTLTITLMLVSILVSVSVFIGKALVSEKRIALNEIEFRVAHAAAEKGIAEAMAWLKVDSTASSASGTVTSSAAQASYSVTMTPNAITPGVTDILSVATLPSGGQTRISVQVAERSILNPNNSGPAAPLVVAGTLPANGNITIVGNPNGGGPGVPVSLWSDKTVNMDGSAQTCSQQAYAAGCTKNNAYSYKDGSNTVKGPDIVENDAGFPDDLVDYLFGEPDTFDGWINIEKRATAIVDSCNDPLISGGAGLFIVEGASDCTLSPMGDKSAPVMIVIKDSTLTINGNGSFYGLIFAYDSDLADGNDYKIKLNGDTKFYGSMISNYNEIELPSGNYDSIYDQEVMCNLSACNGTSGGGGSPFVSLDTVPGSWKDW